MLLQRKLSNYKFTAVVREHMLLKCVVCCCAHHVQFYQCPAIPVSSMFQCSGFLPDPVSYS